MNQSILSPLAPASGRNQGTAFGPARGAATDVFEDARPALVEICRIAYQRKWRVLAIALAVTLPAVMYVFKAAPIYSSSALLLIEQNKGRVVSIEEVFGGGVGSREYMLTQTEFLKSRNVVDRVIDNLGLETNSLYDPRARIPGLVSRFTSWVSSFFDGGRSQQQSSTDEVRAAVHDSVQSSLEVQPVRLSQLIRISFESRDPVLAANVANSVAESYIQADMDARYSMTVQANEWLNEQSQKLRANLSASEKVLQAYRDSKGLIDKQSEAQGGAGRQLEALTQRLVEARVRRSQAEQALAQIRSTGGRALESAPAVMADANVTRARDARARAQLKMAELSEKYGLAHPLYQGAVAELAASERAVSQAVEAVVAGVGKEFGVAKAIEESLATSINRFEKTIQAQNRDEFELAGYEREVNSNRLLLETFQSRAKETNAAADIRFASARIVDRAVPSSHAVKPQKAQLVSLAFVLGGIVGLAFVIFRHRLDQTIDSVEAAEAKLGHPVLAAIPRLPAREAALAYQMVEAEPDSHFSEAIRTVRTAILLSDIDGPRKVVAVTSSLPGEGKSTVSFNLAVALSQTLKTVFVECDMRKPRLAHLNKNWVRPGLSEILAGRTSLGECIVQIPGGKLNVLTAGSVSSNPLEMLSSKKFQSVIKALSAEYDVVVLDTPPVAVVSDAMIISAHATSIVFVVNAGVTSRKLIRRSLNLLSAGSATVLGVVLNRLDFRKAEAYYGEYSGEHSTDYSASYSDTSGAAAEWRSESRGAVLAARD